MKDITREQALQGVRTFLEYIGEDITREGLIETPHRFLKAWEEYWGVGYKENPKDFIKTFNTDSSDIVCIKEIPMYSYCEHHIAPIVGKVSIVYKPKNKVLGLSKFNRIVNHFARRLVIQENLTKDIAKFLDKNLSPYGVAIFIEAEHLCVSSRGVQQKSTTYTESFTGIFEKNRYKKLIKNLIKE